MTKSEKITPEQAIASVMRRRLAKGVPVADVRKWLEHMRDEVWTHNGPVRQAVLKHLRQLEESTSERSAVDELLARELEAYRKGWDLARTDPHSQEHLRAGVIASIRAILEAK